jgi:hypothetical protein
MRSLVDEGAHRSTVAERQMATSRVTAGAKLDTLTRERDEARAQVKKVEHTLLEVRAPCPNVPETARAALSAP